MELALNFTQTSWLPVGARLVGLAFVWTGAIKAVAPHTFKAHLQSLELIPPRLLGATVTASAGLEVGWGVLLLLALASSIVYPLTIAALLILSSISWWGVRSGKAADCGCYGGFIQPSIRQSLAANAAFAALILLAWQSTPPSTKASAFQLATVITAAVVAAAVCAYAQRYERLSGALLFDTNPLKVGGRWRDAWAGGLTRQLDGELLVAFLGPDCPFCAQWVKVGNAVSQSPKLPKVVGVLAGTAERKDAYIRDHGIRFPVATISQSLMGRLAQAVPTTVLVEAGRIKRKWVGAVPPPEFVERVKEAFFPDAPRPLPNRVPATTVE